MPVPTILPVMGVEALEAEVHIREPEELHLIVYMVQTAAVVLLVPKARAVAAVQLMLFTHKKIQ